MNQSILRNIYVLTKPFKPYIPTFIRRIFKLPYHRKKLAVVALFRNILPASSSRYLLMQKKFYDRSAKISRVIKGDFLVDEVVGSWEQHNAHSDNFKYLLKYADNSQAIALDFGCGPGRNIQLFQRFFKRIDGADISNQNLKNAYDYLSFRLPLEKKPNLFLTDGNNCGFAPSNLYDFCFSTICFQHISSSLTRESIFRDILRVLRPGGRISVQMGYGRNSNFAKSKLFPYTVPYEQNFYTALSTNGDCDVEVINPIQLRTTLEKLGYFKFEYWIRPKGPGENIHPNWIYFTALKPNP